MVFLYNTSFSTLYKLISILPRNMAPLNIYIHIMWKGFLQEKLYLFRYSNTKQILITNYLRRSCIIERATETEKSNGFVQIYNHLQFLKWNFEVLCHCHKSKLLLNFFFPKKRFAGQYRRGFLIDLSNLPFIERILRRGTNILSMQFKHHFD